MKNLLLFFLLASNIIFAQEVCENPHEETLINLNAINKCAINDHKSLENNIKETKELTVKISSRAQAFLRRKENLQKLEVAHKNQTMPTTNTSI